jgi:thioredoxin-related protein
MKNLLAICLILFVSIQSFAQAPEVKWLTLEEAQKASKKDGKPIIMDIHTVWCGPCKMLSKITFKDSVVATYLNDNFHAVKFNGEGNDVVKFNGVEYKNPNYNPANAKKRNSLHQLTTKLKVRAYPTILFINKRGEVFRTELGYLDPKKMMKVLEEIVNK